jgi:acyl-CoA thioesterase-2
VTASHFDRLYGGHVLAQALLAASATVDPALDPHSIHACFVGLGNPGAAVEYTVGRVRDSRRSAHRTVEASQHGRTLATALCSYQVACQGGDHERPPLPAPGPEDLVSRDTELSARFGDAVPANAGLDWPFEVRYVDQRPWDPTGQPGNRLWLRARNAVPADPLMHRALLLYASDLAMFEPVVAPLDIAWEDLVEGRDAFGASLDHTMWFHRAPRIDDWLLEVQHSPIATGSRGLSFAHFHDVEGRLVATAAQEVVLRRSRPGEESP